MTLIRLSIAVLILLATLATGCNEKSTASSGASSDPPWFQERAHVAGVIFDHKSGHHGPYLLPEIMCGGAALLDMDNDGDLDLYLVQAGYSLDEVPADMQSVPSSRLYRNHGDGNFDDVTEGSGADLRGYGMGVTSGDYDNDGDADLYVTNLGPNVLLQNNGTGRFTNVTAKAGIGDPNWGTSAAFVDVDHDGDLDLYVCNYLDWSPQRELWCSMPGGRDYCSPKNYQAPMPDVLYRNNGDGTFTDVSKVAGLHTAFGNGLGVVCGDYNADGRVDIFVANDGMPNQLWINQGNGTFKDMALENGCAVDMQGIRKAGMGVAAADFDDDADLDLVVCNMSTETDSLFRNEGSYFRDSTAEVGLASVSKAFTRFGVGLIDFDNDGYLDLYEANGRVVRKSQRYTDDPYAEPNLLMRGTVEGSLKEVSPRGGTAELLSHTSRAAAFGDIDNDGGVDVIVVNRDGPAYVLRNVVPKRGHWIMLRVLDEHSRDAIGATVAMSLSDRTVTRDVRAAYSYCAANDPRVHVGLGGQSIARNVTVKWIDGTVENFGDMPADRIATVKHGDARMMSK